MDHTYAKGSTSVAREIAKTGAKLHGGTWEGQYRVVDDDTFLFVKYSPEAPVVEKSTAKATPKDK